MERQTIYTAERIRPSGTVIEASLWLRLGFFSGAALTLVALIRLVEGTSGFLGPLASLVVGAALATFSVRRALRLFDQESDASADVTSMPSVKRRLLSKS